MSVRNVRWTCPNGCAGVLGPSRPRKDDVRRYCLPCSARVGRLVLRAAPALEGQRAKRAVALKAKRFATVEAQAKKLAAYYTVAGVNLYEEMCAMLRVDAFKALRKRGLPKLLIRRRTTAGGVRGRAWYYGYRLLVNDYPGITSECARETLMHELAHLVTPGAGHSVKWKTAFRVASEQYFGIRPIVEHVCGGDLTRKLELQAARSGEKP